MEKEKVYHNTELTHLVSIQIMDKCLRKEITHAEMNELMQDMLDKEYDFLHLNGLFLNKKSVLFLEIVPLASIGNRV